MHEGFVRFMEASLGTWRSDGGYVVVSRATAEDTEHIVHLHPELDVPSACYKMTWGYTNAMKTGSVSVLAVTDSLPGTLFNSGMDVAISRRYEQYTAPLKLEYAVTENDRKLEWWTDDGVVRDRAQFVGDDERIRTFVLGTFEKVTREVREVAT
jgi:hypothetical protein